MSKKMTNIVAVLVGLCFMSATFSTAAFSQEQQEKLVTNMKKGEKSPYDGVLLSHPLAAEIKNNCSPEVIQKRQDAAVNEAVSLCKSAAQKDAEILVEKLRAQEEKYEKIVKAKDAEIQVLKDMLKPPAWYESPKIWFVAGLVIGGTTAVYIMK
jgi:hypothetical protein